MSTPSNEQLLASAVRFLIDGQEEMAARVLLACSLDVNDLGAMDVTVDHGWNIGYHRVFDVTLTGPRIAYDILSDRHHTITQAIQRAIEAIVPSQSTRPFINFYIRAELVNIEPNWRTDLLAIARGVGVNNQGLTYDPKFVVKTWNNLRFRSTSEIKIAEALDRAGVMFLPNCLGRLGLQENRKNREADFLVCADGKWGILEVDGEPFHPPSRTADDHERDRLFKLHGLRIVEHFDATKCYEQPDTVVQLFLDMLRRS